MILKIPNLLSRLGGDRNGDSWVKSQDLKVLNILNNNEFYFLMREQVQNIE
jgi:hypothetical protein